MIRLQRFGKNSTRERAVTNSGRWWESYLVRYGIGTVVGAICVHVLLAQFALLQSFYLTPPVDVARHRAMQDACLDALALDKEKGAAFCKATAEIYSGASIDIPSLLLLGTLGLAYCYLASAPGLVVHAIREQIVARLNQCLSKTGSKPGHHCTLVAGLSLVPIVLIFSAIYVGAGRNPLIFIYVATLFGSLAMFLFQLFCICKEYCSGNLREFYQRLHYARESGRFDQDSYKHLREHGNAFFIVLLELVFLLCLLSANAFFGIHGVGAFVFFWILPAAVVYFLGHKIEAELVGSK